MKKIRPRNGNVVLIMREADKTAGGIITTTQTHDEHMMTVESVGQGDLGPDGKRVPIDLKPGDIVYVAAGATYSGYPMPDGTTRLVVNETMILAVEEDDGVPQIAKLN